MVTARSGAASVRQFTFNIRRSPGFRKPIQATQQVHAVLQSRLDPVRFVAGTADHGNGFHHFNGGHSITVRLILPIPERIC